MDTERRFPSKLQRGAADEEERHIRLPGAAGLVGGGHAPVLERGDGRHGCGLVPALR